MTKLSFEMSEDARLLSQALLKAKTGETFSYPELSKIIGKPMDTARGALMTARRHALREEGIVFGVERGVGIRRLTDDEIVTSSVSNRKSISNKTRRSAKELHAADFAKLSNDKQLMSIRSMSVFKAIQYSIQDRSVGSIPAVAGTAKSLPIRETLEALLRSQRA